MLASLITLSVASLQILFLPPFSSRNHTQRHEILCSVLSSSLFKYWFDLYTWFLQKATACKQDISNNDELEDVVMTTFLQKNKLPLISDIDVKCLVWDTISEHINTTWHLQDTDKRMLPWKLILWLKHLDVCKIWQENYLKFGFSSQSAQRCFRLPHKPHFTKI